MLDKTESKRKEKDESPNKEKAGFQFYPFRVSLWKNEREIELAFPPEWDLVECKMIGHDFPVLSDSQIQEAFENPIGTQRIRDLAKGKQKIVILFDDITRPTPTQKILPFVFRELKQAGVAQDKIRLVCAIGCHRPLGRDEMIKKLGREVLADYLVFNHNAYEHHVNMGTTSRGTPVLVNREVAGCDLKIGIGSLIPHGTAGYAGGAKILLPGVCSIDSVAFNHKNFSAKKYPGQVALGNVKNNHRRLDMEEAARIAGLDVVVNVALNHKKEILKAFVGDFVEGHREGINFAKKTYSTPDKGKFDLMILNAYPIEETPRKAFWAAHRYLNDGGDVVLICRNTDGVVPHFLLGTWGSDYGGRNWYKPGPLKITNARKLFVYTEAISKFENLYWGTDDKVCLVLDWEKLIESLKNHHGRGTRVGIFPYATLQYPFFDEE